MFVNLTVLPSPGHAGDTRSFNIRYIVWAMPTEHKTTKIRLETYKFLGEFEVKEDFESVCGMIEYAVKGNPYGRD